MLKTHGRIILRKDNCKERFSKNCLFNLMFTQVYHSFSTLCDYLCVRLFAKFSTKLLTVLSGWYTILADIEKEC